MGVGFQMVMFIDKKKLFGVVNEFNHDSDVNELGK